MYFCGYAIPQTHITILGYPARLVTQSHVVVSNALTAFSFHACFMLGLCGLRDATLSAHLSVADIGSPSANEVAWTLLTQVFRSRVPFPPEAFGGETSGRKGRQSSELNAEDKEIGVAPCAFPRTRRRMRPNLFPVNGFRSKAEFA